MKSLICVFFVCLVGTSFATHLHCDGESSKHISHEQNPFCPADINGDGSINIGDLLQFLKGFGASCNIGLTSPIVSCPSDLNGDGEVNVVDLNLFLVEFGNSCPIE